MLCRWILFKPQQEEFPLPYHLIRFPQEFLMHFQMKFSSLLNYLLSSAEISLQNCRSKMMKFNLEFFENLLYFQFATSTFNLLNCCLDIKITFEIFLYFLWVIFQETFLEFFILRQSVSTLQQLFRKCFVMTKQVHKVTAWGGISKTKVFQYWNFRILAPMSWITMILDSMLFKKII